MPARAVTPGPNAFAQQAARNDRHRYEGNAFYQQDVHRRITPPTMIHPALRSRSPSHAEQYSLPSTDITDARGSAVTTMSPFLKAEEKAPPTPPLKLVPDFSLEARPTNRGYIEETRERTLHQLSGSDVERTPVYHATPKIPSIDFSKSVGHVASTPKKKKGDHLDLSASGDQFKTPRKNFLNKLWFPMSRNNPAAASTTSLPPGRGYGGGENLPPKAKAVLDTSPHQAKLARSPSKKKNPFSDSTIFGGIKSSFSRKSADVTSQRAVSLNATTPNNPDSAGKTPQTGLTHFSDPSHNRSDQSTRVVSQSHSERTAFRDKQQRLDDACGVTRSQSLQYFDRKIPPTPPAKDTPPHEKEQRPPETEAEKRSREIMEDHAMRCEQSVKIGLEETLKGEMVHVKYSSKLTSPIRGRLFENDTPTRETVKLVGQDGRLSPTKNGGYAHKDVPTLIKQPSIHSMHGAFYPDLQDEFSFQEVKKRTDGLGLQGLREVPEKLYDQDPKFIYSPSQYSMEWSSTKGEPSFFGSPNAATNASMYMPSPSLHPMPDGHLLTPYKTSLQTNKGSNSSIETLKALSPGLHKDSSWPANTGTIGMHHNSISETSLHLPSLRNSPERLSGTPRNMASMFHQAVPDVTLSPPQYSCASAVPSPLQYLPATTYTPPPRKRKDRTAVEATPTSDKTVTQPARHRKSENTEATPSSEKTVTQASQCKESEKIEATPSSDDKTITKLPRRRKENTGPQATPKASRAASTVNKEELRELRKAIKEGASRAAARTSVDPQNFQDDPPAQHKNEVTASKATPKPTRAESLARLRQMDKDFLASAPEWFNASPNTSDDLSAQREKKSESTGASPKTGRAVDESHVREINDAILASSPTKTKRASLNPFDNVPSLGPDPQPPISTSPPAYMLSPQSTEPQKQGRLTPPTSTATVDSAASEQQQLSSSPDRFEQMMRRVESQQNEISNLRADLQSMRDFVASQRAESVISPSSFGGGDSIASTSSESRPTSSSTADEFDNISDDAAPKEDKNIHCSSPLPAYVPTGALDQLGLYHRYFNKHVDPQLSRADWDDLDRHENSANTQRRLAAAHMGGGGENQFKQVMDMMGQVAEEVKEMKKLQGAK